MKRFLLSALIQSLLFLPFADSLKAQSRLYPQLFDLDEVQITGGPFLHAQTLNWHTLLQYDVGRLLQPYEKQAGLPESGSSFNSWGGLDGHVGGHYLSAVSISYASCHETPVKAHLKDRLDSMVNRLKQCQDAWSKNENAVVHGYCGGVPRSFELWTALAKGDFAIYKKSWAPFYNIHKTMAGLRDAWVYAGNETAKVVFLKFCDWGVNLISQLTDDQVQDLLANEPGGINEMFADAYQMTGDNKYLAAAKRYSHHWLLSGMASQDSTILDNQHANTQVPKAIGFERIAQLSHSHYYDSAAKYFWEDVTGNRSIAIGGNSVGEWFPSKKEYGKFIYSREGVETCNTYNMLKLTESLFADDHNSQYTDFIESALYNHILSTQNPHTGGYVYFTPERPQHYRVYSRVNQNMWCCVGTGMENQSKYSQFIYSHNNDSLFVNLFVPTTLDWKERGVNLAQTTRFPYGQDSKIIIKKGGKFTLMVRHPSWAAGFKVSVNGRNIQAGENKGYFPICRTWRAGDTVQIDLPMKVGVVPLQNYTDYVAFVYGPIVLGAKTGTSDLDNLFADNSPKSHVAVGKLYDLYSAPLLIGSRDSLARAIELTDSDSLHFRINGYYSDKKWNNLVLEPFAAIHEARYMMYWLNIGKAEWLSIKDEVEAKEAVAQILDARTIDYVDTGTQQSETDHGMEQAGSSRGAFNGEYYRDGLRFSYLLQTNGKTKDLTIMCRYWGGDKGNREFDIKVDGVTVATEKLTGGVNDFVNKEYRIPERLLKGKSGIRVEFVAKKENTAGGIYFLRLLTKK